MRVNIPGPVFDCRPADSTRPASIGGRVNCVIFGADAQGCVYVSGQGECSGHMVVCLGVSSYGVEEHGNAYNTVNIVSDKAAEATPEVGL
jgi:hypothetical protein